MKKSILAVTLGLLCLGVVSTAEPSGCVVRSRGIHHAGAAHHAAVVTAVPVAVAVPITIHSVSYAGSYESSATASEIKALRQEIEISRLRGELSIAQQLQSPAQQKQPPAQQRQPLPAKSQAPPKMPAAGLTGVNHPAVEIMDKSCIKCHSADAANAKGGGFNLQGTLTERDLLKITKEVYSGRMPPGGILKDEQVAEIMAWIDGLK